MRQRRAPNPKRRLLSRAVAREDSERLANLAQEVSYGGNPEHKRNPGDFGLEPPAMPRQAKSLCDNSGVLTRAAALALIREGLRRGIVSQQERNGWPQNIWAVTTSGIPVEAMLENAARGAYHGYPMLSNDPLADEIIATWRANE